MMNDKTREAHSRLKLYCHSIQISKFKVKKSQAGKAEHVIVPCSQRERSSSIIQLDAIGFTRERVAG